MSQFGNEHAPELGVMVAAVLKVLA